MPVQPDAAHAPHMPHVAHGPHAPHPVAHGPQPVVRATPAAAATAPLPVDDDLVMLDEDAITLEDDGQPTPPAGAAVAVGAAPGAQPAAPAPKKITFNADALGKQRTWKRKHTSTGTGACRVKTFHGKCSDQGLEYLDDAINMFLDEHPDIDVKFVQSNIGMFDGKFKDFALIVNVWY
jgi:hypothetical protein